MLFNEIYPPILVKKQNRTCPRKIYHSINERLKQKYGKGHHKQFQMQLQNRLGPRWYKKFIPLYAEHLHFLIKKAVWLVTKIYENYTFGRAKFKQEFVLMNQKDNISRRKRFLEAFE